MGVEVSEQGGVSVLQLNRPPVNALDLELLEEIVAAFGSVTGPVVVTGSGRCFSAGVDLRAILDGGVGYSERFLTTLSQAFLAVFDHPAPVVAAVNGHAIAGGCVIAMAADVRLMAGGSIGISELVVGVPFPIAALEICRHGMGTSAGVAALSGAGLSADDALARGWVHEVVHGDQLVERAVGRAAELGGHSPAAYALTKEQLHRPARTAITNGAADDERARAGWTAPETRERIEAFLAALTR